ncbi:MAG TPA: PAS domain-containing methyl-accepting chemotaxis protein [Motiliproteus sp.]
MKLNHPVTQREKTFPAHYSILSTTDLKGAVTYANEQFSEVAGFSLDELVGKNHNIVRHPDMPPAAYQDLWDNLKAGNAWMGIVKNRCKNGDHYWVDAFVTPISNNAKVVEYQSVRFQPKRARVERAEATYKGINQGKLPGAITRPATSLNQRLQLGAGIAFLPVLGTAFASGDLALMGAAGLSLALLSGLLFWQTRPLARLVEKARGKVSNKLMQYIYTGKTDDISQIDLAIKMYKSELRAVVGRVEDTCNHVQMAADVATTHVRSTTRNTELQQQEIEQIAAAVEEMSATSGDMAGNTAAVSTAAKEARRISTEGKASAEKGYRAITALVADVEHATQQIAELAKRSSDIGMVLDVIKSIAEQTNLLALNAAIEAARAGEQGRGFAVVADEVRTLAQRTQDSTSEIESMIAALQSGVNSSVGVMQHSKTSSEQAAVEVQATAQLLEQINSLVDRVTDLSIQVATATEEQSAVSAEVSGNLARISELAIETHHHSATALHQTETFVAQIKDQRSLVRQFRNN